MAGRRLAATVVVDGVTWTPSDSIPPDVAECITNPKAWTVGEAEDTGEVGWVPKGRAGTSCGAVLAATVHVAGEEYGPDDVVPLKVAACITNPKAWVDGVLPSASGGVVSGAGEGDQVIAGLGPSDVVVREGEMVTAQAGMVTAFGGGEDRDVPALPAPSRAGKGSGLAAWQAYAAAHRVEVSEDALRDEIIAACVAAGVADA